MMVPLATTSISPLRLLLSLMLGKRSQPLLNLMPEVKNPCCLPLSLMLGVSSLLLTLMLGTRSQLFLSLTPTPVPFSDGLTRQKH